jgi:hypothetical protein
VTRISSRVRNEAALICAVAASNDPLSFAYYATAAALGIGSRPCSLALAAWTEVYVAARADVVAINIDAETESLLRTGWSPGDPVERIGGGK